MRASSPPGSPPKHNNNRNDERNTQLLQELEALSHALHRAQRKGFSSELSHPSVSHQPQEPNNVSSWQRKHSSTFSHRETMLGRRFSSYEPGNEIVSHQDPIPLPGMASGQPPPSFSKFLHSRRSMSPSLHHPSSVEPQPGLQPQPTSFSSQNASICSEQTSDIRSRMERRLSLQPGQGSSKHVDNTPEEIEWPGEAPDVSRKGDEKKKGMWKWKPFRALSHIGRHRLHCVFSAYVHAIEGLPVAMNGLRLSVYMRKGDTKEGAVQTMPNRVFQGITEFQETLFLKCTLYSASKGNSSTSKFMDKTVIVSVIAPDIDEIDFGKHQLDLSRLLSDAMDDQDGPLEKGHSWDTTLDLTGKAKGAKLIITFNYEIVDKESASVGSASSRFQGSPPHRAASFSTSRSLPNSAHGTPRIPTAREHLSLSPSVSGRRTTYGDLIAMEHLNLDEPAHLRRSHELGVSQEIKQRDVPQFISVSGGTDSSVKNVFGTQQIQDSGDTDSKPNSVDVEFTVKNVFDYDPTPGSVNVDSTVKQDLDADPRPDSQFRSPTVESSEDENSDKEFEVVQQGTEIDNSDGILQSPLNNDKSAEGSPVRETAMESNNIHTSPSKEACDKSEEFEVLTQDQNEDQLLIDVNDKSKEMITTQQSQQDEIIDTTKIESSSDENNEFRHEKEHEEIETEVENESEKEEKVTYKMVMQTLDSLIEGTNANEEPEAEALEEMEPSLSIPEDSSTDADYYDATEKLLESIASDFESDMQYQDGVTQNQLESMTSDKESNISDILDQDVDNEVDLVAGQFLDMLNLESNSSNTNYDSEPDTPRGRLLKQFEKETHGFDLDFDMPEFFIDETNCAEEECAEEETLVNTDKEMTTDNYANSSHEAAKPTIYDNANISDNDDENLRSIMEAANTELQKASQTMQSKVRAKLLEDAETEALMQEWGIDEKAFATSPLKPSFIRHAEPPNLAEGLGAEVPLKDGGSLRSMSPSNFKENKTNGKLVMQVSRPIVVPADMGSGVVDILQNMSSMGLENMAFQAMNAMPLEDITGRSIEDIAYEGMSAIQTRTKGATSSLKEYNRHNQLLQRSSNDHLSIEDLAPKAMQQIEALAMDGLKIQADVAEDEAPYSVNAFAVETDDSTKNLQSGNTMLKGVTGVHLVKGSKADLADINNVNADKKGLMNMAISLDDWMLLDAGQYEELESKKDTRAIMAAHHVAHQDLVMGNAYDRKKQQHARWGCMGNTITIAMLVQLRDPVKNNEAVGVPMMAFIQAERMVKPPKPKVGRNVPFRFGRNELDEDEVETKTEEPQFTITDVHMAGLKAPQESQKKALWGNQKQQQTGSRWLIANGMSKNNKIQHPLLKSKNNSSTSSVKVNKGESLWSISSRVHGSGNKWKDIMKLNPHIRNPDVISQNQTIRIR